MNDIQMYHDYCSGCGLCKSENNIRFERSEDGQYYAFPSSFIDKQLCDCICPSSGNYLNTQKSSNIWGDYKGVFLGYSNNKTIRNGASSGGIITELSLYLLDNNLVDGIIHVEMDSIHPYETVTTISRTREDVLRHMGSRYSISTPLKDIRTLIQVDEKYAFIGKPCDVSSLRVLMEKDMELNSSIVYLFSFFCAGQPSMNAQKKLLNNLECYQLEDCYELSYRGNGWPGFTTCKQKNGKITSMTYEHAWGDILGREVKLMCRFCFDGIGLCADVVCGDGWYLDNNNNPIFKENEGRNIIFARTDKGLKILQELKEKGMISLIDENIGELKYMQYYQHERRATMIDKLIALKLMKRDTPKYKIRHILPLVRFAPLRRHLSILKGTLERIKAGKI